jgi:hypothetical protein
MMAASLCAKCQIVLDSINFTSSLVFSEHRYHHDDIDALEASAREGCQLCVIILVGFSDLYLQAIRAENASGPLEVIFKSHIAGDRNNWYTHEFFSMYSSFNSLLEVYSFPDECEDISEVYITPTRHKCGSLHILIYRTIDPKLNRAFSDAGKIH